MIGEFSQRPPKEKADSTQSYTFGEPNYIPETQAKIRWECRVSDKKVEIIQRGGPLECIILTIEGKDLEVTDSWEWGQG